MNTHSSDKAETARYWIVRIASGSMTEEEFEQFRAWCKATPDNEKTFKQERKLWRSLTLSATQDKALRLAWQRKKHRYRIKAGFASFTALAACVALFVYAPFLSTWLRADQWSGKTLQTVALADGSNVVLDSDSAIAMHYSATHRTIALLRGNAFFDVKHDAARPFEVMAHDVQIEDVGTQFEVRSLTNTVTITVKRGVVDVRANHNAPTRLYAGERLPCFDNKPQHVETVSNIEDIAAWSHGELILENATVAEAVREISRYHHGAVYVLGAAASTTRISGLFHTNQPDEALAIIAATAHLNVNKFSRYLVFLTPA